MTDAEALTKKERKYSKKFRRPWYVEWTLADDLELKEGETPETFGPECKTSGSMAYDLKAVEDCEIKPGEKISLIKTGIKMKIPYGYGGFLAPRSGLGVKGLTITNTPGYIDSDYRGEIKINFVNLGTESISWKRGDRIAQIAFVRINKGMKYMADGLSEDKFINTRGESGHGSTGMGSGEANEKSDKND